MATGKEIVAEARTYLGTKFRHQGRIKGDRIDCIGLLVGIAKALNIPIKDCTGYSRHPDGVTLIKQIEDQGFIKQSRETMQEGDLLVFYMTLPDLPGHVGVYCGDNKIIHTWSDMGYVVEHELNKKWVDRIHSVYRFPGVS